MSTTEISGQPVARRRFAPHPAFSRRNAVGLGITFVLGLANVFLKPLVTFIALPLILLTFGIAYFFVNVVMLLFTEWVTPDFSIGRHLEMMHFRRAEDREHYAEGLRKAGLPE